MCVLFFRLLYIFFTIYTVFCFFYIKEIFIFLVLDLLWILLKKMILVLNYVNSENIILEKKNFANKILKQI